MNDPIRVTIWNENIHETNPKHPAAKVYPEGIHGALASHFRKLGGFSVRTATLQEPQHGLTRDILDETDVLIWWAHVANQKVSDEVSEAVRQRVLSGMGLIVLHSAMGSKAFRRLVGTNCSVRWREADEKERLWNVAPGHEITQGIGDYFEIPHTEMYGEWFDIPEPDRLIFISWFEGGEVFRSGCVFERGNGRIFYFRPGHETLPIYYQEEVLRVITNAVRWTAPRITQDTRRTLHVTEPLEKIGQ